MKVGDLVTDNRIGPFTIGIVLEHCNDLQGSVTVAWWQGGELIETNTWYVSELEVLSV